MNPNKPWKVVLLPTLLGVLSGKVLTGRLLEEYEKIIDAYNHSRLEYKRSVESNNLKYYSVQVIHNTEY